MKRNSGIMLCGIGAISLAFVAGYAIGQQGKPPAATQGLNAVEIGTFDLDGEIDNNSVAGRRVRVRRITIEPGGATQLHNHVGKPEFTYVLQGS